MRSFAMLLPCGISLFSGVEFVCCPKHFKGRLIRHRCAKKCLETDFLEVVVALGDQGNGLLFTFLINSSAFIIRKVLIETFGCGWKMVRWQPL